MLMYLNRWIAAFMFLAFVTLTFVTMMGCANAHAGDRAFRLVLEKRESLSSSAEDSEKIRKFFDEVEAKLPERLKAAIDGPVEVRFKEIEEDWPNRCQWNQIMGVRLGSSHGKTIELERSLRQEILRGEAGSSKRGCGYPNAYRFAMSILIHEVAHVYNRRARLSRDPMIQTLLGAAEIGGIFPTRRIGEGISSRSPDISEFENPEEGFATNFERYVTDPEYACRRPTLARVFSLRLGWDPFPGRECQVNPVVPLSQQEVNDAVVRFVSLDPKRLYQVHYLFASKGKETMSRWGHAMFRLVFCAPSRAKPGPECLQDVSYHVVVSFRANVQGNTVDPLKGMNGDYPSQLYLLSLLEVMREYNSDGLRDLISLPLKLSQDQVREFLNRSLQVFWEYRGKYQFLSNNCATEALNLLKSIIPDPDFQNDVHVVTPVGLYDALKDWGLMDDSPLADQRAAKSSGYLFPSERGRLDRAFGAIQRLSAASESGRVFGTLDQYIEQSKASERAEWFSRLSEQAQVGERGALASQFFILESYLIRFHQARFFKMVVELLRDEQARKQADPDGTLLESIERVRTLEESLGPQKLAPTGYGIAMPSDYRPDLEQETAAARSELMQLLELLRHALEARFPERYQELLSTAKNRKAFAQAMGQQTH